MRRTPRAVLAMLTVALAVTIGPAGAFATPTGGAGDAPATTAPPPTEPEVTIAGDRDVSQCISAVERPGCDTGNKGGILYAVFGALVAGLTFVGWRVARSIRARDRRLDEIAESDRWARPRQTESDGDTTGDQAGSVGERAGR